MTTMTFEPIIITNVIPEGGAAFAIRVNGGESVFIPPSTAKNARLEDDSIGTEVLAKLIPNHRSDTPYRAAFIDQDGRIKTDPEEYEFQERHEVDFGEDPSEPLDLITGAPTEVLEKKTSDILRTPNEVLEKKLLDILKEEDRILKTKEVYLRVLNGAEPKNPHLESNRIGKLLEGLKADRRIAKVAVWSKIASEKVSFIGWAKSETQILHRLFGDR